MYICLVWFEPNQKKNACADLLGWCEYKPSNHASRRRGGVGSLPNEPWCGSLEKWKQMHLSPTLFEKSYASLDATGTRSTARIMGIVWFYIFWYLIDIPSPLLHVEPRLIFTRRSTAKHVKRTLENMHKNADAFDTFSTGKREKEFDRSADQCMRLRPRSW